MSVITPSKIDLSKLMVDLSLRRKVFHSEADFQHELAWQLRTDYPDLQIRLEHPRRHRSGAIDVVAYSLKMPVLALELKYLCAKAILSDDHEQFDLKAHGAYPLRRYDVIKDLVSLEEFKSIYSAIQSAMIVLTNDQAYWNESVGMSNSDADFRFCEGRRISGLLDWAIGTSQGLRKNRDAQFTLRNEYHSKWENYSNFNAPNGRFRFVCLQP